MSAQFVAALGAAQRSSAESLRRARDELRRTVQELRKSNEALQIESLERKHGEEAQAELARVSRLTTIEELTVSLAHDMNQPVAAAVTSPNSCFHWLAGGRAPCQDLGRSPP
jgi:C4-dicarboxylate-specific signal transduction histidine kinase